MTSDKRVRGKWADREIEILKARYPHEKTEKIAADLGRTVESLYYKSDALGLKKTEEYLASDDARYMNRNLKLGEQYRFKKGQVPQNKGTHYCPPGAEKGWFKKGHRSSKWKPIGHYRVNRDGYLEVKINDTGHVRKDYALVHHLVWELHHGTIPIKHYVMFKDGNKENAAPENLALISQADNLRRQSIHNLPKELKEVVWLNGRVKREISRRLGNETQTTDEADGADQFSTPELQDGTDDVS